jgi:hypothetical protein
MEIEKGIEVENGKVGDALRGLVLQVLQVVDDVLACGRSVFQ